MPLLRLLNRLFHGPAWLAFLVMGFATGGFALCSFNLFELFHANFQLIATYGAIAPPRPAHRSIPRRDAFQTLPSVLAVAAEKAPRVLSEVEDQTMGVF